MLVANLDYSDYLGRLAICRIFAGTLRTGDEVGIVKLDGSLQKTKITKLYSFEGLKRIDETIGRPGDILAIAGVEGIQIGETITDPLDAAGAAQRPDRRADDRHDLHDQHLPPLRPGGNARHVAQPSRAAREGAAHERLDPGRGRRRPRQLQRQGARRAAARDPDRDDAPRGVRADGRQARDPHQDDRRDRSTSRSSSWSSTVPSSSSASSSRSSDPGAGR